jgi:Acyl-ACP thioesterase
VRERRDRHAAAAQPRQEVPRERAARRRHLRRPWTDRKRRLDVAERERRAQAGVLDGPSRRVQRGDAEPGGGAALRRFDVRFADIDMNRHVNNASYLAWALECASPERWAAQRLRAAEVHYLSEAVLGDVILARTDEQDGALVHAMARESNGRELARVRTHWTPRGQAAAAGGSTSS